MFALLALGSAVLVATLIRATFTLPPHMREICKSIICVVHTLLQQLQQSTLKPLPRLVHKCCSGGKGLQQTATTATNSFLALNAGSITARQVPAQFATSSGPTAQYSIRGVYTNLSNISLLPTVTSVTSGTETSPEAALQMLQWREKMGTTCNNCNKLLPGSPIWHYPAHQDFSPVAKRREEKTYTRALRKYCIILKMSRKRTTLITPQGKSLLGRALLC